MARTPFTVIIPAHNEAAVIARCLDNIHRDAPDNHAMEIIVAANGCSDATAHIAREAAPDAHILELPQGSKTAAINAANAVAGGGARIVLDADVECSFTTLAEMAEAVGEDAVMIAAPAIRIDVSRANALVRAYYRVWERQPYARQGKGGAGCYALSQSALDKIGPFPEVIADDAWIHTRFPDHQRRLVAEDASGNPVFTTVHPPRTALEQIRVEARRQIGNRQLREHFPSPHAIRSGGTGGVVSAIRGGASLPDVAVFFTMKLAARLLARWRILCGRSRVWTRDESSRQP